MLAATVMIIAIARSASITDVFQVQSWVQSVGTSSSVGAERTTDVAQIVQRWRWYDGSIADTTKIDLTRSTNHPKIVPILRQPRTISHRCRRSQVLPSQRPCTRRCTPNLTSLLHCCTTCSLVSVHRDKLFRQLFHQLHIAGGSCGKCQRKLPILRRMLQMTSRPLAAGALANTLHRTPICCTSRFQSAASLPAAGPGSRLTRSCCCHVVGTVTLPVYFSSSTKSYLPRTSVSAARPQCKAASSSVARTTASDCSRCPHSLSKSSTST